MQILSGIPETRAALRELRNKGTLGLVPTMGALHAGHGSLLRAARERCEVVAATIFVNPTQFAPNEDFNRYPRTLDHDCRMLEAAGIDLVFTPSAETMYPAGGSTFIEVAGLSDRLDGASRPGHFRGVATIVAKLFNIIQPDFAFFGQKDAAQVAVLRQMVRDLNLSVQLVTCPIVREPDGLAMSSRNRYLSGGEREQALSLYRALEGARTRVEHGEFRATTLLDSMRSNLQREPRVRVDYVAAVDPDTLLPLVDVRSGALLAIAAYVGDTRLIDNILLPPTG